MDNWLLMLGALLLVLLNGFFVAAEFDDMRIEMLEMDGPRVERRSGSK